jgi:GT2 family glycosyltransferase
MRGVSVVIPNWNGEDLLRTTLPAALAAANAYPGPAEVIVVDDGSTDASRDVVKAHAGVRLVEHDRNRGFGPACLTGATSADHEIVFLLNSDARPDPGALAPLARAFDAPEVFAASPIVLDESGAFAGVTISVPYVRRGKIRYRKRDADSLAALTAPGLLPWYTFFPLGGAMAVDRARFLALGGFDDLFHPFYHEDVDLGFRAWRRGWSCVVVPESRVVHAESGTIGRAFKRWRVRLVRKRNRMLLHCKNLTGWGAPPLFLLQHTASALVRLLRFEPLELLGTLAAVPRIPAALERRRIERRAAVRSDAQILALIDERWQENLARLEGYDPRRL